MEWHTNPEQLPRHSLGLIAFAAKPNPNKHWLFLGNKQGSTL